MKKIVVPLMVLVACLCQQGSLLADINAQQVHVSISNGPRGSHTVEGQFFISASSGTIWNVLSDYDHLSNFVSTMKSSKTVHQDKDNLVVEQVMTGNAGFFKKRVQLLLEINETPPLKISFKDISKKSFKTYSGYWEIVTSTNEAQVLYKLEATPDFFSPNFIAVGSFKKNVKLLLEEVRNEIARREQ